MYNEHRVKFNLHLGNKWNQPSYFSGVNRKTWPAQLVYLCFISTDMFVTSPVCAPDFASPILKKKPNQPKIFLHKII